MFGLLHTATGAGWMFDLRLVSFMCLFAGVSYLWGFQQDEPRQDVPRWDQSGSEPQQGRAGLCDSCPLQLYKIWKWVLPCDPFCMFTSWQRFPASAAVLAPQWGKKKKSSLRNVANLLFLTTSALKRAPSGFPLNTCGGLKLQIQSSQTWVTAGSNIRTFRCSPKLHGA